MSIRTKSRGSGKGKGKGKVGCKHKFGEHIDLINGGPFKVEDLIEIFEEVDLDVLRKCWVGCLVDCFGSGGGGDFGEIGTLGRLAICLNVINRRLCKCDFDDVLVAEFPGLLLDKVVVESGDFNSPDLASPVSHVPDSPVCDESDSFGRVGSGSFELCEVLL